jgi:hypothetical protein
MLDSGGRVKRLGVEDRNRAILGSNEQHDLCAAEDNRFRAALEQSPDDVSVSVARVRQGFPATSSS